MCPSKSGGLELKGGGAVACQNVRLWKSSDSCCPRKRHSWVPAGLSQSPSPLSFRTPKGRLGQGQLSKERKKICSGPEITRGSGLCERSPRSPSLGLQGDRAGQRPAGVQSWDQQPSPDPILPATSPCPFHPGPPNRAGGHLPRSPGLVGMGVGWA